MIVVFRNAAVLRNHEIKQEDLWVENGKCSLPKNQADCVVELDNTTIIAPGYIDIQINGGFGFDFSSGLEAVQEVAKSILHFGVTSFLPTIVTSERTHYLKLLKSTESYSIGAEVLGLHLEGPFINPEQKGAHNASLIRDFNSVVDPEEFYGDLSKVRMVTLAPEIFGALTKIPFFTNRGIVVSIGHTQASSEEVDKAVAVGATLVTHLFNAMTPFHHRAPGVIGATLANRKLFYSVICDGIHVDPGAIKMAWMANPERLVLISDAISALGLEEGDYRLGTMDVRVNGGKAVVKGTETLAGSVLRMDQAVKNLKAFTGCSTVQALEAASLRPAQVIGVDDRKGRLDEGYDADFVVLDQDLNVQQTYRAGERVFSKFA